MSDAVSFDEKPDFVPHDNPFKRLAQHPVGFWFVFAGELAERASYYGMRTILALYLTTRMGFTQGEGATVMKIFMASCYLTPYLGGFVADRYLGRFKTIAYYSIPYILGHLILGGFENRWALFIALTLLALGSGAIKPNTSVLMGMIYEKSGKQSMLTEAFSLFYMAVNIGAATTSLSLPIVRDKYGYGIALMIPAVMMAIAFGFFVWGKRYYPEENVRAQVAQPKTPEQKRLERRTLVRVAGIFGLIAVFWLIYDQNADTWIYFADHHCKGIFDSVQKVGHLFAVPGYTLMVPAWLVLHFVLPAVVGLIGYFLYWFVREVKQRPLPTGSTTRAFLVVGGWAVVCVLFQLIHPVHRQLDWSWNGTITGDQVQGLNPVFIIVLTPIFNFIWNRWKKARGGKEVEDTAKMMIGFIIVIATAALMTIAGFLALGGQVTVWWVIIATFVVTLAELCISVVGLEFAYKVAAPGTKSVVTGAFHSTVFAGDSVGAAIAPFYENGLAPFQYFGLQAVLMTIAAILFVPISRRFQRHADMGSSGTAE